MSLRKLFYRGVGYISREIKSGAKSIRKKIRYRGASYEETGKEKIHKQINNRMSYRGVSYTLFNSEIKVK